ncbi:hypothetical protein Aph01nite_50240 [Acrocarpospora phusangensis]|uniref:Pyridoxamine 5'-phosphate oxidase putative domain-containing protein n=1 Tax=Acrocarpospora phusangensis TaxID=1070424 RepID=A0A919QCK3_9ACTN|nr:pyridoxamine 5'-phosphate oxidase family protein [Acrocarpospora phusangensis]GIH26714.1 hypothetical protein Aph01nite_50240 [Acrocarpospora phusangensis]
MYSSVRWSRGLFQSSGWSAHQVKLIYIVKSGSPGFRNIRGKIKSLTESGRAILSVAAGTMGGMASWQEIESEAPEFAARVLAAMGAGKHKTMATLRKDGSPRISGTELEFKNNEVWLGSMLGAMKALDLRRDPRVALHSPSVDPDSENPSDWPGEAKLSGLAVEITDPADLEAYGAPPGEFHLFRLDIREAVFTRVDGDHLVIESWAQGRGLREIRRK